MSHSPLQFDFKVMFSMICPLLLAREFRKKTFFLCFFNTVTVNASTHFCPKSSALQAIVPTTHTGTEVTAILSETLFERIVFGHLNVLSRLSVIVTQKVQQKAPLFTKLSSREVSQSVSSQMAPSSQGHTFSHL